MTKPEPRVALCDGPFSIAAVDLAAPEDQRAPSAAQDLSEFAAPSGPNASTSSSRQALRQGSGSAVGSAPTPPIDPTPPSPAGRPTRRHAGSRRLQPSDLPAIAGLFVERANSQILIWFAKPRIGRPGSNVDYHSNRSGSCDSVGTAFYSPIGKKTETKEPSQEHRPSRGNGVAKSPRLTVAEMSATSKPPITLLKTALVKSTDEAIVMMSPGSVVFGGVSVPGGSKETGVPLTSKPVPSTNEIIPTEVMPLYKVIVLSEFGDPQRSVNRLSGTAMSTGWEESGELPFAPPTLNHGELVSALPQRSQPSFVLTPVVCTTVPLGVPSDTPGPRR